MKTGSTVLARHRGEQLAQRARRAPLGQAVSVEGVFQATLLPQTEGSVATFLLLTTSYESSEGSLTVMGIADLALPMVTWRRATATCRPS